MFRVAKKMIGSSDCASDIVQDVFLSFYNKLTDNHTILYTDSWLYRATTNKCIDILRHNKKYRPIDWINDNKAEEITDDIEEDIEALNNAVSKLKIHEKALVVLYSEGLTYKEIADATGIRFSSVGKTLSRILDKLEKELKKQEHELYQG